MLAVVASLAAVALAAPSAPAQFMTAETAKRILAMEVGTWDADITFAGGPGQPDKKARGVQENRLRSAGMWMLNLFSVADTPYEGTGIWGFDRTSGRFSGVWVDNNDQQIRLDDGRWNEAKQSLTWNARMVQANGTWMVTVATERFAGDTRTFDMTALSQSGEVPLVHIVFKKRP